MRIAIINSYTVGGAARAALRLHQGFRSIGIDSQFLNMQTSDPSLNMRVPSIGLGKRTSKFFGRVMSRVKRQLEYASRSGKKLKSTPDCEIFSSPKSRFYRGLEEFVEDSDVLNLHWVAGFVDLPSFLKNCGGRKPIIWTLHDMRAMTGGCHYNVGCNKYESACRNCPQLLHQGKNDASARNFETMLKTFDYLNPSDLTIVCPSRWLQEEVQKSRLLKRFSCYNILNGLNTSVYFPVPQTSARQSLGLPLDKSIVLFAAESLSNRRKGFDLLLEAFKSSYLRKKDPLIVTVGGGDNGLRQLGYPSVHYGSVASEDFLRIIYSAADLFVIPSRQDNLPNTALEAIACGTPVVSFRIGGIADVVRPGLTGWLADSPNSQGLCDAIAVALDDLRDSAKSVRSTCREVALSEFSFSLQARRYESLFNKLIRNK